MEIPLNVLDYLNRAEQVYPDRVAMVDEPGQASSWGESTYAETARRARSQAAFLDRSSVSHGARVAVMSQNSSRLLASFFGVSGYGRVLVPVNFRLARAEVGYILEHSGAEVLLVDPSLADLARTFHLPVLVAGDDDGPMWEQDAAPQQWGGDESATATINYTSGTTGRPKGVQLTHRNLWLNAATFGWHTGVCDDDVYLHTLPMFHVNGWGMPYAVSGMGGKHVVLRQVDGAEILRRVQSHGVTLMCAAPAVLHSVLDALPRWQGGSAPGRDRTRVVVAGAPPPTRTVERVRDELGWELIQIYGMTESSPLITMSRMRREWEDLPRAEQAHLLARAGAPTLGVQVRTAADGEVLSRSNHALAGYWRDPDGTERVQGDGWLHTGDGGAMDGGYLSILDRKKDVIITGGENVSSIEVEDALVSHPGVREVAVIGVPDERWGEAVTALVVRASDDVSDVELVAHCRERLAGYKIPKRIEFRDHLERTETGKLQKFKLRAPYWEGAVREVN